MRIFEKVDQYVSGLNPESSPRFSVFRLTDVNPISGTRKDRLVYSPNKSMRVVHKLIADSLFYKFGEQVTGFVKGSSPRMNAVRHKGSRFFYLIDIQSAFTSVDGEKLAGILATLFPAWGDSHETFNFLRRYCLDERGGLLTGAPASPLLFNILAAETIDRELLGIAARIGGIYTRYGDDIAISTDCRPLGSKVRRRIRSVIVEAGFLVNNSKSRVLDKLKGTVLLTGVALTPDGRVTVPRRYFRRVRGLLYLARQGRVSDKRLAGASGALIALLPNNGKTIGEARLASSIKIFWRRRKKE